MLGSTNESRREKADKQPQVTSVRWRPGVDPAFPLSTKVAWHLNIIPMFNGGSLVS